MQYLNARHGVFVDRPNRFIANVSINGLVETVHVKNTGRCRELLLPGCEVILNKSDNPGRKTAYDLVAVYKSGVGWINIDSQAPNIVVAEWLAETSFFGPIKRIKPEYVFGESRIDFFIEAENTKILIEVKGCTLEIDGVGYFPDAPTERGVKHLHELSRGASMGYECYLAFVIAIPDIRNVLPNTETHPEFAAALDAAKNAGVKVLFLPCDVEENGLHITECILS